MVFLKGQASAGKLGIGLLLASGAFLLVSVVDKQTGGSKIPS